MRDVPVKKGSSPFLTGYFKSALLMTSFGHVKNGDLLSVGHILYTCRCEKEMTHLNRGDKLCLEIN